MACTWQRQAQLCEFEASLVDIVSYRLERVKKINKNKNKNSQKQTNKPPKLGVVVVVRVWLALS